jgi:lipid-A-disaccharide synthase
MARLIDLVLCIFPFEADLYNQSGLRAVFVGHPMIERLQARRINAERDPSLIGLFPGSRIREVRKIFPVMVETARQLLQANPHLYFEVAAASDEVAEEMSPVTAAFGQLQGRQVIQIRISETAEIMQHAWAGMVASGSATLEAAYFRMPFVLIYKVAWPTYFAARAVVNVNYLGMPNLLAEKEVVPEFIQRQAKPGAISRAVRRLMENTNARKQMISEFDSVTSKLGGGEASETAARAILKQIGESTIEGRLVTR